MELMSSMLLCALAALLPQTLGRSEFNSKVVIRRAHKTFKNSPRATILNMNGAYTNENSDLQKVYEDVECQKCHNCMDRAMKALKALAHLTKLRPSAQELHEDLLRNKVADKRYKRDVQKIDYKKKRENEKKPRKNKPSKMASVTKYDFSGKVYALKVKDVEESGDGLCQIYSVKKLLSCDSPEIEALLIEAKKDSKKIKFNKTTESIRPTVKLHGIPNKSPTTKSTTEKIPKMNVVFKKREIDNTEVPDFMPSIEEMTFE